MRSNSRSTLIPVKIKICGITRSEDARVCVDLGAEFIGLVFASSSPRCVNPREAGRLAQVVRGVSAGATRIVGVFRDQNPSEVRSIALEVGLDYVQLHGNETRDMLDAIGFPVIKALHVGETVPDPKPWIDAEWLLYDTRDDTRGGGTGRSFDWSLLSHSAPGGAAVEAENTASSLGQRKFFLAGGLDETNVSDAIRIVQPDAIDVSSGVEQSPGIKSRDKIERLMEKVRGR